MAERFVGIDVALREHRIAVLDRDGEAVGQSFTIAASTNGVATLLRTLDARAATAAQTLIGLEASGHLWENLEAALVGAGYRVLVLNPLQTRRYRDVVRRKAKTDDIDAHVIAGLLRSGAAQASYVPDEPIQSLRELARLRARLMADRQDYLRQLVAQLDVVLPEHHKDPPGNEVKLKGGRRTTATVANRLSWIRPPGGRSDGAGHRLRESR
jgi:transposase